ncbi:MAG: radical SAM protein [Clostridia bacterium]|nr:radical SAM protein [Clostridia bacterium]
MLKLSKYSIISNYKNCCYIFNLNNGALLKISKNVANNLQSRRIEGVLAKNEIELLKKYDFVVENSFDKQQSLKNQLTYSVSKYNHHKDSIKIDFALTNKCNFCCPYCFEKQELNKNCCTKENDLQQTGEKLFSYIKFKIKEGIKNLDIVFYGGEPTLEAQYVIKFIKRVLTLCKSKNVNFHYVFVTNGYLFNEKLISKLDPSYCKFIQITLDGEKEFHNNRRTNCNKINTFDIIIENIKSLLNYGFYVVVRLNVDKTNYKSISSLLTNLKNIINNTFFGKLLTVDIARVFGSENSFDLLEFEDKREELYEIAKSNNLVSTNLGCKDLTTFCIAESLSSDLVIDQTGRLYRCWNNVFNEKHAIWSIDDLKNHNYDPYETSAITLEFVNELSLLNTNHGKCFDCEYSKYCGGLCPNVRKLIKEGKERNIYKNDDCKLIMNKRITQLIRWKLEEHDKCK